jgi:hypothetical protein
MKKDILSWNEVKQKYLEFHKMDKFTENMAIDIDFGYWLVNNCNLKNSSANAELIEVHKEISYITKINQTPIS